jgi:hypothetical protein
VFGWRPDAAEEASEPAAGFLTRHTDADATLAA